MDLIPSDMNNRGSVVGSLLFRQSGGDRLSRDTFLYRPERGFVLFDRLGIKYSQATGLALSPKGRVGGFLEASCKPYVWDGKGIRHRFKKRAKSIQSCRPQAVAFSRDERFAALFTISYVNSRKPSQQFVAIQNVPNGPFRKVKVKSGSHFEKIKFLKNGLLMLSSSWLTAGTIKRGGISYYQINMDPLFDDHSAIIAPAIGDRGELLIPKPAEEDYCYKFAKLSFSDLKDGKEPVDKLGPYCLFSTLGHVEIIEYVSDANVLVYVENPGHLGSDAADEYDKVGIASTIDNSFTPIVDGTNYQSFEKISGGNVTLYAPFGISPARLIVNSTGRKVLVGFSTLDKAINFYDRRAIGIFTPKK